MIFQTEGAIAKIIAGDKTQTRRKWNAGDKFTPIEVVRNTGRIRWYVGQIVCVQPGRGKRAVWYCPQRDNALCPADNGAMSDFQLRVLGYIPLRIEITAIRYEDVRTISDVDAKAEGYLEHYSFLGAWCAMHDKPMAKELETIWSLTIGKDIFKVIDRELAGRDAANYAAAALTFRRV